MQGTFAQVDRSLYEDAWTMGATRLQAFRWIALPLGLPGIVTAAVLSFAHTLGEFGVVLMVGGNIPGSTRVISIAIYDHVEALEYGVAHRLALILLLFAFAAMVTLYAINRRWRHE